MKKKFFLFFLLFLSICGVGSINSCSDDEDKNPTQPNSDASNNDSSTGTNFELSISGNVGNHDYVDLGLSVKWATYNLGSSNAVSYGNYYTWGGISQWNVNSSTTYSYDLIYCNSDRTLYPEYDVATNLWGNYWRMPSKTELYELVSGCTWNFVEDYNGTGIAGYIGTSKKNKNTIFIPAGGFCSSKDGQNTAIGQEGYYWSSNIYNLSDKTAFGEKFSLYSNSSCSPLRTDGILVRAVTTLQQNESGKRSNVSGNISNHDYVDLGLSVKWATLNLGALKIEDYGKYYAWGETKPWAEYTYDNYILDLPYCNTNRVLLPKYDAATQNWGEYWRMPTKDELEELHKGCSWYFKTNYNNSGINGYLGVSMKNGNEIFIPASGLWNYDYNTNVSKGKDGYYRASDYFGANIASSIGAWGEKFIGSGLIDIDNQRRADGISIRPVTSLSKIDIPSEYVTIDQSESSKQGVTVNGKIGGHSYVNLGLPSGRKWATYNIGASSPEEYGNYYAWGENVPKTKYTWDSYMYFTGYDKISNLPQISKYVRFNAHGQFDNKLTLDNEDDVAYTLWGNGWHMPTQKDLEELVNGCTWKRKDKLNGSNVIGWIGYSKYNNMEIYLPAAGWEYSEVPNTHLTILYWSSDIYIDDGKISSDYRAAVIIDHTTTLEVADWERIQGCSVRAVY